MTFKRIFPLLLLSAPIILSACSPVGLAVGGAAAAGTTALQERGMREAGRDTLIKTNISERFFRQSIDLFGQVTVSVIEGRVLLTGIVPNEEARESATRIAWGDDRVREVLNEVMVGAKDNQWGRDTSIQTQLRARIMTDSAIDDINYSIDVAAGNVYLLGIAQDQAEIDRVLSYARDVGGVRRVVNHVMLKNDPRRRQAR